MTEPMIAQKSPIAVEVTAGKSYWWCTCGRSAKQPFCDGSHKETGMSPLEFAAEKTETVHFCACKATGNRPRCDGTHKSL